MKKLMIAVALIIGLNAAQAQKRGDGTRDGQDRSRAKTERGNFNKDPEARAKAKVEHLDKELKLTPAQKETIHALVLDQAKQQQAARKDANQNREAGREQFKAQREQNDQKIVAVLDDNQKQQYAELQKKRTNWNAEGRKRDGKGRSSRK